MVVRSIGSLGFYEGIDALDQLPIHQTTPTTECSMQTVEIFSNTTEKLLKLKKYLPAYSIQAIMFCVLPWFHKLVIHS